MSDDRVAELEIVAGHVWNAVGGVNDGHVRVEEVDPKRFGVEVAAATTESWTVGKEGDVRQLILSTLRPFKPMDLMIVEKLDDGAGTVAVITGTTRIRSIEVNGVNQFTAKNPIESAVFGTLLSAPRPRIRFDTVQTAPSLTMDMEYVGSTIGASAEVSVNAVFSGVAVKR